MIEVNAEGWTKLRWGFTWESAARWARSVGLAAQARPAARVVLEDVILPYFGAREDVQRVLFIGMDRSTRNYWRFFRGKEYWSIDFDPANRKHAGRLHITDSAEHLDAYFRAGHFDLIVCRDVHGWGRVGRAAWDRTFAGCWSRLRPGGNLVLGAGDPAARSRFGFRSVEGLARFRAKVFPPLSTARHEVEGHVFEFYERPCRTVTTSTG